MMKYINVSAQYPEENTEDIINALATALRYKESDGDKLIFIERNLNLRFEQILKGLYHTGKNIQMGVTPIDTVKNPRGLGDSITNWINKCVSPFKKFGIWLSMNCGCDSRRKWLNKHFPYKQK